MSSPTQAELEILNIVWSMGEARVQDVHDKLNMQRDIGYTTSLKLMQVMEKKGLLDRRRDGRSHIYFAAVKEEPTKNRILDGFISSTFNGSRSSLFMHLLGNEKISKEEIDEIRSYLKQIESD